MRPLVFLLLLANLTLFGYIRLDQLAAGEGVRLSQQVLPEKVKLLTAQQVAALGPAKVAELNGMCLEWGPFTDAERARATAALEPLQLGRLLSQRRVETTTPWWVYISPSPTKASADSKLTVLRSLGIRNFSIVETGPQRLAISLGGFRTEDAANAYLATTQQQGLKTGRVGQREQVTLQTLLVVRDPSQAAAARLKELQNEFAGSEVRANSCEKTG